MAVVANPELRDLVAPWDFHFDLLGHGSPPWPWVDHPDDKNEAAFASEAPKLDAAGESSSADAAGAAVSGKDRKKERKTEKRGGFARGFLTRPAAVKELSAAESAGDAKANSAQEAASSSSSSRPESKVPKKKKTAPGHHWSMPPLRYEFTEQSEIKIEQWRGVEQVGEIQKPTKAGVCYFYRLPSLVPADDVGKILSQCKQSKAYVIDPDSVDQTPTFEFYPFRDGEWVDMTMKPLLEGVVDRLVLPYIRERYNCRFCAVADILIRRYIPGERRTHAVHFDGHAFVTAVLGLCDPDEYEGGIYLQPEPDVASRMFLRIEPGDLVVHSFDLQHGVHIWKGARYSLIIWVKDSLKAVRERTTPWYDKLADAGDPDALYNAAQNYEYGTFGRPRDIKKAIEFYERSAAAGHHFAQNNLGLVYRRAHETLGLANGLQRSFEWLRAAAEAGFAMGQKNLALAYANGQGVKKDDAQAVVWMRRAAEQLEVEAAYMMGEMYRQGRGVPVDGTEAAKWYERSADSGFPKAQYTLGMLHLEGQGMPRDVRKAEMWLGFAAKQGHAEAKNNLATMHAQRGEVDQAADIWADLAKGGEPNSQCNIGMCYMRGVGREQDLSEARRWLSKAAKQGHQMAAQALVQLGSTVASD